MSCGYVVDLPHVAYVCFWRPKRPHSEKKTCRLAIPLIMGQRIADFSGNLDFLFLLLMGQGEVLWVKKRCCWVSWTRCEVADLKQRQEITTMDHRNKIQSLVLPIYDPGDAPDCITEYGPCTCECGRMCHTAPTAQKYGFSLEPKLHLAFLVRPEPSNSMPAA